MAITVMIAAFAVLLALGTPIAFAMGGSAVLGLLAEGGVPLLVLPQRVFSSLDSFSLLAIPLFLFAGELMNTGGVTSAIVKLARSLVGHFRGGLGQVNIVTSIIFAGISGSAAADCAAVGSMLLPAMAREGYKREWSAVITASASILGPIIPPSILMILYGAMTGLSVSTLFLAGILPGLMMAGLMMALVWVKADALGAPRYPRATAGEIGRALLQAGPALVMPVLIVGGILWGVVTPTEAGIVAVTYGMFYGFATRQLRLSRVYEMALHAAIASASILIILGSASLFSWIIAREGIPAALAGLLTSTSSSPTAALLLIVAALLLIGMFIETISALILVVPVLAPVGVAYGFDPVHFSMVIIVAVLLGSLTPPVAVLLLLACKIGEVEYSRTMRPLVPFLVVLFAGLAAIMFIPGLTLWVPRFASGYGVPT